MTEREQEQAVLVTDLKQWAYCPRIVYYRQTMGGAQRPSYKMEEGKRAQGMFEVLELRRSLKRFGFGRARRSLNVWLEDKELGVAGKVDMLLEGEHAAVVVDFKLTAGEPRENHKLQLAGYAVLAERVLQLPVRVGFFYRIPDSRLFSLPITTELRERVAHAIQAIRDMRTKQWCPDPTPFRQRCIECEYVNFCGDVW